MSIINGAAFGFSVFGLVLTDNAFYNLGVVIGLSVPVIVLFGLKLLLGRVIAWLL